jgi:hypothetical protein
MIPKTDSEDSSPPIDSSIAEEEEQQQQQQQAQAQAFRGLPNPLLKLDVHSLVK